MRELLDKNGKREKNEKEENYLHVVSQCFLAKLNES